MNATRSAVSVSSAAATTTGWPGATRIDHGAPVGYAHTEAGALQAATNYDALEGGDLVTDPEAYRAAYQAIVAPAWSSQGADQVERVLADAAPLIAAAHSGRTVQRRDVALSSHVSSFSPSAAEVTIWSGVISGIDGVVPPTLATYTAHYALVWLGDWKVSGDHDAP